MRQFLMRPGDRCLRCLRPDESVVLQGWAGARVMSGGPAWQGAVLLTSHRIICCQGGPAWLLRLVRRWVGVYEIELNAITRVERYPAAYTSCLDVILNTDETIRFGISERPPNLIWSNKLTAVTMTRWATEIETRMAQRELAASDLSQPAPVKRHSPLPTVPYAGRSYRWAWWFMAAVWVSAIIGVLIVPRL